MADTGRKEKDLALVEDFETVRALTADGRSVQVPKSKFGGNLEIASANVLGGIKAAPKEATDTNEVKIDPTTGKLYCPPSEVAVATSSKVGGIVAEAKTDAYTKDVRIDSATGKLFVEAGEGTPPDDEDITIAEIGGVEKLQFKNKKYNASSYSGLGRKYLRKNMVSGKNVLTQAMFTNDDGTSGSNTRFIVQYDYDLNGATISVPNGCVLDFQGGSINNGNINGTGIRTVNKNRGTSVFLSGVNMADDNQWVKASDIGMKADNESMASVNDRILDAAVAAGKYIELDGTYYFSGSHNISGELRLKGGKLVYTKSNFLIPMENSSLIFEGVNITGNSYFIRKEELDYVIKDIIFDGCTIENIRVCYVSGKDVSYETTPYGLERFRVNGCKLYNMNNSSFVMPNLVISKECAFENNYVSRFQYSLLDFGKTNEYSNITDNEIYGADVVFKNNVIRGAVCNNSSYYTPLLLDGVKRAFFEGNTITNVIGVGTGGYPTYECYGSCTNYSCKDNVFINVCQLPKNGVLASTHSEIFKCKGGGGTKEGINNVWKIDFNECREILAKEGFTFTDEAFETINEVTLFGFTSVTDYVYFINNSVTIKGGRLVGRSSSADVRNMEIRGNTFNLDSYKHNSGMFPSWNVLAESITITSNKVSINDDSDFTFCGMPGDRSYKSNAIVTVSNNIVNRPIVIPSLNARMTVVNNIQKMYSNAQINFNINGADEVSIQDSYLNYKNDRTIRLTPALREFKNIDYRYTIHNVSKSNYMGVSVLSGVSADLMFECGDKAEFRAKNTDDEISVTDKYGNTLATSSNTSYVILFENSQLKVSVKYGSSTGFYFYIVYKVDDLTYKLNIASIDMNKIGVQTLNKYAKGAFKFDTTTNKPVWWNGTKWVDATGADA